MSLNFGWRTYEGPERTPGLKDEDFPYHKPFAYYKHGSLLKQVQGISITSGKAFKDSFYFLDWHDGLFQAKPDLTDLQKTVPITEVTKVDGYSAYTALGVHEGRLVIGGTRKGKGVVTFFG